MTLSYSVAWFISIGVTALLYISSLACILPLVRAHRHLRERWSQYGGSTVENWQKSPSNLAERRMQSIQMESKLNAILARPYPLLKRIKFLFYRSNLFPNIKVHIACQVASIVFLTEIFFIFLGHELGISFLLAVFISLPCHFVVLRIKENFWQKSFIKIFPISLDIIIRGLKSGMTLGRGIAMVSEEVEDPVGAEFSYMASQLQIGVTPDDALVEASSRIGIDEFRFFSLALIIQREMGGSLADILAKLSEVIRERDRFRKKVWTLSSESRATALIVGSLPVLLGITIELISPGYMKFFLTDPKGKIMLWICGGLSITGAIVILRMMRVED